MWKSGGYVEKWWNMWKSGGIVQNIEMFIFFM